MQYIKLFLATMLCVSLPTLADEVDKKDAAIGAGVGGALGAVIGDELGDRKGAIVGSAVGAAVGTAIATQSENDRKRDGGVTVVVETPAVVVVDKHPAKVHCPPGQAKKGRC